MKLGVLPVTFLLFFLDGCSMHLTSLATGMLGMSVYGNNWEMQRETATRKPQKSSLMTGLTQEDEFSLVA